MWDAISANWGAVQELLQGPIGDVYAIVSTAFLVIGAILLFSGCTPANIVTGLALIAMGAAGLVATAGANWGWTKDQVSASIALVFAVVSVAFLVIGAILVFSGAQTVLGIGLLAAGAVGLAATVGLNWESMNQALEGPVGVVFALISGALLVLGAILAFSGANLLVGIGLIAAGAVGLIATAKKLKWDTIENTLKGPIGAVTAVVSAALLAIGAIIAFSGAGLPLGIALIATGAAGLVTTAILNWNTVKDKIKPVLSGITAIASASALALGVILCLSGAGIPLGLPLIAMGIAGSVTAWNLNDNPLTRFVKNLANGIIKIINRITQAINDVFHIKFPGLRINGKEIIPRFESRLMNIPQIPLLAKGAVIPPNAPFLATLGDQRHGNNIEAPEDLIRKIVREESGGNSETLVILRAILAAIQESGNTRISINGRDVFQAIVEENARAILRNGSSPLKV